MMRVVLLLLAIFVVYTHCHGEHQKKHTAVHGNHNQPKRIGNILDGNEYGYWSKRRGGWGKRSGWGKRRGGWGKRNDDDTERDDNEYGYWAKKHHGSAHDAFKHRQLREPGWGKRHHGVSRWHNYMNQIDRQMLDDLDFEKRPSRTKRSTSSSRADWDNLLFERKLASMVKRARPGWGKRGRPGWGKREAGWGKRDYENIFSDKRFQQWGKRRQRGGWGKRRPGWGKREPGWGKRRGPYSIHPAALLQSYDPSTELNKRVSDDSFHYPDYKRDIYGYWTKRSSSPFVFGAIGPPQEAPWMHRGFIHGDPHMRSTWRKRYEYGYWKKRSQPPFSPYNYNWRWRDIAMDPQLRTVWSKRAFDDNEFGFWTRR